VLGVLSLLRLCIGLFGFGNTGLGVFCHAQNQDSKGRRKAFSRTRGRRP
jgi:hypothetical protein